MPIDNLSDRVSALNVSLGGVQLPVPDGTISSGDRQHAAGLYAGILSGSAGAATGSGTLDGPGALLSATVVIGRRVAVALSGPGADITVTQNIGHTAFGALVGPGSLIEATTVSLDNSIWDNNDEEWGQADLVYSEARPIMLVAAEFYRADDGVNFGDQPIEASLTRTGLAIIGRDRFGQWTIDPTVIKEIVGLYPIIKGNPGTVIQIWCGSQESPDDSVAWEGPYDFRVGIDSFLDFLVSGRYLAVRFTSVGQLPWELMSYGMDIAIVGGR